MLDNGWECDIEGTWSPTNPKLDNVWWSVGFCRERSHLLLIFDFKKAYLIKVCFFRIFIFFMKIKTPCHRLSPFYNVSCDQGFQIVMWCLLVMVFGVPTVTTRGPYPLYLKVMVTRVKQPVGSKSKKLRVQISLNLVDLTRDWTQLWSLVSQVGWSSIFLCFNINIWWDTNAKWMPFHFLLFWTQTLM